MGGKYGTIDIVRLANVADPHKNIERLKRYGHNIASEWRKENGTRFKVWHLVEASTTQTEDNSTKTNKTMNTTNQQTEETPQTDIKQLCEVLQGIGEDLFYSTRRKN